MTDKSAEYRVIINEGTAEISFYRQKRDLSRFFSDGGDGGSIDGEILDSLILKTKDRLSGKAEITGWSAADEIVITLDISENGQESAEEFIEAFLDSMAEYYEENEMHVTRMFGSYVHLKREDGELRAVKATPIPIRYCPLMTSLLTEVGGDTAVSLLRSTADEDPSVQTEMMCRLINDVVIKGGYFDTSRPLNSCEANVLFGASETMSTAFRSGLLDAAVIVSNNLGTIITTNDSNTQGAVKRMTGLFMTSPAEEIMKTAYEASIIPVFPHSAAIDQTAGVRHAVSLGYKNIAVSVATHDNINLDQISSLEKDGVCIYKFGLCSTGIDDRTAEMMENHADLVWACASKAVRTRIEPNAVAQVGIKIPVYIMTQKGWDLVKNHLQLTQEDRGNAKVSYDEVQLQKGSGRPVILNDSDGFKIICADEVEECTDCPHPLV